MNNKTLARWSSVYRALKRNKTLHNVRNNFNNAFNANNNNSHLKANTARNYFNKHPNKRVYISAAYARLPKSPAGPQKSSKFKNAVNRAVVYNALMTYVTKPSLLKQANYQYRYKKLVKYLKNNPITITKPLYRGVPKSTRYMPNKGYYNSGNRLMSFAKNIKTARFFARKEGTIYVLPPGKYPAFNINANVKRRYPTNKKYNNALVRNYIGYAKAEDEVLVAPGVFKVGNSRTVNNRTYKNLHFIG